MDRAQFMSELPDLLPNERAAWLAAAQEIRRVRTPIRGMMHTETRAETY